MLYLNSTLIEPSLRFYLHPYKTSFLSPLNLHEHTMQAGTLVFTVLILAECTMAYVPSLPLKAGDRSPSSNRQPNLRMAYHDVFVQYTPRSSNNPKTWMKEIKFVDVPKENENKVKHTLCESVFVIGIRSDMIHYLDSTRRKRKTGRI
jgi:hypothetical protein